MLSHFYLRYQRFIRFKYAFNGAGAAKASAMFIRKYGKKEFVETLNKMHQKYDFAKMQEILGNNPLNGLLILEKFKNDEEVKV